jgi:hypothetical protein
VDSALAHVHSNKAITVLTLERVSWQQSLSSNELHLECRPWAIVMIQDAVQRSTITRFRNRQDADDHLRAIRRHMPQGVFEVVFDPPEQPMRQSQVIG